MKHLQVDLQVRVEAGLVGQFEPGLLSVEHANPDVQQQQQKKKKSSYPFRFLQIARN